jgi:hypothetical protein
VNGPIKSRVAACIGRGKFTSTIKSSRLAGQSKVTVPDDRPPRAGVRGEGNARDRAGVPNAQDRPAGAYNFIATITPDASLGDTNAADKSAGVGVTIS